MPWWGWLVAAIAAMFCVSWIIVVVLVTRVMTTMVQQDIDAGRSSPKR